MTLTQAILRPLAQTISTRMTITGNQPSTSADQNQSSKSPTTAHPTPRFVSNFMGNENYHHARSSLKTAGRPPRYPFPPPCH